MRKTHPVHKTVDLAGWSRVDLLGSAWTTATGEPYPAVWGDRGRAIENVTGAWVPCTGDDTSGATFVRRALDEPYYTPDERAASFVRRVAAAHAGAPMRLAYVDLP